MKIDEAIKILKLIDDPLQLKTRKEVIKAARLGIEALELITDIREDSDETPERSYWFREFGLDKLPSEEVQ